MTSLLILKERKLGLEKRIIVIWFWEKYPSAKEPMGPDDIIFVYSRQRGDDNNVVMQILYTWETKT